MSTIHVHDIPAVGAVESTLRQAATLGIVADADFSTNLATTLANIDARNADVRSEYLPIVASAKEAVGLGFRILGSATMVTDLATIYAAIPADWQPGFAV